MVILRDGFFYPTLTQIIESFRAHHQSIYLLNNKLPEIPEYAKIQFYMMTLLDVLGYITWVR